MALNQEFDAIIIGAGIIGSAVARSLLIRKKAKTVAVLEKEPQPAVHTSGRNSGVVHSGFNLKPGSLKAKFCVEGNAQLRLYCEKKNLPLLRCGTLVVALQTQDIQKLNELYERGQKNGVPGLRLIDAKELKSLEPNALGLAAVYSPSGSITSGKKVTQAIVEEAENLGGKFQFGEKVSAIEASTNGYRVQTNLTQNKRNQHTYTCQFLFNCGGLYADELAHQMGVGLEYRIVPFRGEYYQLCPEKSGLINSMIYPVPDLAYPFLGIHWTKTWDGGVMVGPNATIAMGRESYHPFDVKWGEAGAMMLSQNFRRLFTSPSFRQLAWQQIKISFSRKKFIEEANKLVRGAKITDFEKGKCGNRAQLVDSQGRLVDDMVVERQNQSLHVLNAVSPGFTCALPFADYLVDELMR